MDSSDKLYFDKILTSLDGINASLGGGGAGTPETVTGFISCRNYWWVCCIF